MGAGPACSGSATATRCCYTLPSIFSHRSQSQPQSQPQSVYFLFCPKPLNLTVKLMSKCANVEHMLTAQHHDDDSSTTLPLFDYHRIDQRLLQNMAYDALVWASLHGLLVGDKSLQVHLLLLLFFLVLIRSPVRLSLITALTSSNRILVAITVFLFPCYAYIYMYEQTHFLFNQYFAVRKASQLNWNLEVPILCSEMLRL